LTAWPRSAQWAAVCLLLLAVGLLAAHTIASLRWGTRPTELDRGLGYRVDLNQADRAELLQLPGVGPSRADEILAYRKKHGRFRTIADLQNVSGIGPATLERLWPWVCVGSEVADEESEPPREIPKRARPPRKPPAPAVNKKAALLKGKRINVNTASAAELQQLPRIGEKLARRIIAERRKGRFKSVEDLQRIRGIKGKTLEMLRPFVTTGVERGR
jgi:competence protein ComEA